MTRYYAKVKLSEHREFEVETRSEHDLRKLVDDMTDKLLNTAVDKIKSTKLSS